MIDGLDGFGIKGLFFCGASILALSISTVFAFFYFWRKGRLGFDEEAKFQMMQEDDNEKRK